MDCRILRQMMVKADGNVVCDDSNGYFINLGQVSDAPGWSVSQILTGGVYAHVRRSFSEDRVPWPGICETCDLFSKNGIARDTLAHRMRIMVEPTLHCRLACPTCKRGQESRRRGGSWNLSPDLFAALLKSCAKENILVEEVQYLGWGEPLLHAEFAELTRVARALAPAAVQEVTTTGNIEWHDGLAEISLDRIVVSCDGVRQDSYGKFRRNGDLAAVQAFMKHARAGLPPRTFLEWKYIVFDTNDTDEELLEAQRIAEAIGVDSLLFILTNSKNRSRRFDTGGLGSFPLKSSIASVMPAAAMMKTSWVGQILPEQSNLGEQRRATLYLDRATITESDLMVLEGWSLGADMNYVESIDLIIGNQVRSRTRTIHRRQDVLSANPGSEGPDSGFIIRFPIDTIPHEETLLFAVATKAGEQRFHAKVQFKRVA
jgi:hypothetical protein